MMTFLLCLCLALCASAEHIALVSDLSTFERIDVSSLTRADPSHELSLFCQDRWLLTRTSVADAKTIQLALAGVQPVAKHNWTASLELVARYAPSATTVYLITDSEQSLGSAISVRKPVQVYITDASFSNVFAASYVTGSTAAVTTTTVSTLAPTTTLAPVSTQAPTTTLAPTQAPTTTTTTAQKRITTTKRPRTTTSKHTTTAAAAEEDEQTVQEKQPETVRVVGHVYYNAPSTEKHLRLSVARGFHGVPVTLRGAGNGVLGSTATDGSGQYVFENVPVDTVLFSFDTPPGFTAIEPQRVALRAGGVNRIPPVELKFDARHAAKVDPLTATGEWSTESIVVVTLVSVASFVAILVVIFVCIRRQSTSKVVMVDDNSAPDTIYQRVSVQLPTPLGHGLKSKRV